jgi:hypothetical protein
MPRRSGRGVLLASWLLVLGCADSRSGPGAAGGDGGPAADVAADGAPDAGCDGAALACVDDQRVGRCVDGELTVTQTCDATEFCAAGQCATRVPCAPGDTGACWSVTHILQCNQSGTGFAPSPCGSGLACIAATCQIADCTPGQQECVDATTRRTCDATGHWQTSACPDDSTCAFGACTSSCDGDFKWQGSNVGCEYWTVDLDMGDVATLLSGATPPAEAPHSIALSNPGDAPATVTLSTLAAGIALPTTTVALAARETREVVLPRMDLQGAGIFDRSVRIQSTRPIVATQFNPKDVANTFSNDSSLLLPVSVLGTEYLVLGWESQLDIPFSIYPALLGYFAVVAVMPGTTQVTVTLASEGRPVTPGGAPLAAGVAHTFALEQYQVLQVQGVSKTLALENDMSGSHVQSDKRVAVFTGHEGPLICPEQAHVLCPVIIGEVPPDASECSCCLEHLEEQLWPLATWSSEYLIAKARPRGKVDFDTYRVQAGTDNVTLATDPPVAGLHGKTIAKRGQWLEAASDQSFRITGTGPIQVAQYLASMECVSSMTGDPSMIMAVGIDQYRSDYPLLVPTGYDEDWLSVVREVGSATRLDGAPVQASFSALGTTGYEVGYVRVQAGTHRVEGDSPFGLTQYGFFEATSYGNPVGLSLRPR